MCFTLDADTCQPVSCGIGTSAQSAADAALEQLGLAAEIFAPASTAKPLVVADAEYQSGKLFDRAGELPFDLLAPMQRQPALERRLRALPETAFRRHWAGYSVAVTPYQMTHAHRPLFLLAQRSGERPEDYWYKAFVATTDRDPVEELTLQYPKRWHIEEFFNLNQALGWQRAGTMNLNIRYGQMAMALLAQTVLQQLRQRWGAPWATWDAAHFAKDVLAGLSGAVAVKRDTIRVTLYNAPHVDLLRRHYENLPQRLSAENIDPRIPWLYGFKLDFQFR